MNDAISRRLKNTHDSLFENLNNYHEKIKFTIETNPEKFLDTRLLLENNIIKNEVYRKTNKLPVNLKLKIPKRCKRNAINGDLCRSWRISPDFYYEKNKIGSKFSSAGYPLRFVNSVISDFESKDHDPVIRNYLFNNFDSKSIVSIDVPFCNENDKVSKQLLNKFNVFTKEKYYFRTVWKRKRIWELFPLKEKNPYPSCKIYEGICSCKENYVGETKRDVIKR